MDDLWQRICIAFMYVGGVLVATIGVGESGAMFLFLPIGMIISLLGVYWRTQLGDWSSDE